MALPTHNRGPGETRCMKCGYPLQLEKECPRCRNIDQQLAKLAQLVSSGQARAALPQLRKLAAWVPNHDGVLLHLARCQKACSQPRKALETLQRLVQIAPSNEDGFYEIALLLSETGRLAEAREALDKCLMLAPQHAAARQLQQRLLSSSTQAPVLPLTGQVEAPIGQVLLLASDYRHPGEVTAFWLSLCSAFAVILFSTTCILLTCALSAVFTFGLSLIGDLFGLMIWGIGGIALFVWMLVLPYIETGRFQRVTERSFPRIFSIASLAARRLGLTNIPDLFVKPDLQLNAYTYGVFRHFVVLHSSIIEKLKDDELVFVIGHEMGHIKSRHAFINTVIHFWMERFILVKIAFWPFYLAYLCLLWWQRLGEYSCDRAGLLACGKLEPGVRAMFKIHTGITQDEQLDLVGFLADPASMTPSSSQSIAELFQTHPVMENRIRNMVQFYHSEQWLKCVAKIEQPQT